MTTRISVGKDAAYIYVELMSAAFSGYILWLLLSRITTAEVIGASSTAISVALIFSTVVSLGIPNGITRYLGKMFSEQNLSEAKQFIRSASLLTCMGIAAGTIVMMGLQEYSILGSLGGGLLVLAALFMASSALAALLRNIIIAAFEAVLLPPRQIFTSGLRILLSLVLVLIGGGAAGLVFGYAISQAAAAILAAYVVLSFFKEYREKHETGMIKSCKTILAASIPSWIPSSIVAVGVQAGTIIVFEESGSGQAGTYFIAFSLFSAISMISTSLISAAFPALSAMTDGRKRFSWRIIKISLIISLPLSSSFIFYSEDVLGILGPDYVDGARSLEILLLSVIPTAVVTAFNTLVYAYGKYKQVLMIGLALSVPRTLLYFLLVPLYSGDGAAISYTVGAVAGFLLCLLISKKIGFRVAWKELVAMLCITLAVSFGLSYGEVSYIIGVPSTILISYVVFVRFGVISRQDIQDTLGILPHTISNPSIKALNIIGQKIRASY